MKLTRMAAIAASIVSLAVSLAVLPRVAGAQAYGGQTYGQDQPREEGVQPQAVPAREEAMPAEEAPRTSPLLTPFGMAVSVGGGVSNFTDDTMDDLTDVGGNYDARLVIGTRMPIALEAAYVGTAQDIAAIGLDEDAVLVSNGVEANVRLNLGTYALQPFVFGGASYVRYDIVNEDFNNSSIQDDDDTFALPVGGGLSARFGSFIGDARFTYREIYNADMIRSPTGSSTDTELNNWNVSARIGFEF